jgi:hypothetical protein
MMTGIGGVMVVLGVGHREEVVNGKHPVRVWLHTREVTGEVTERAAGIGIDRRFDRPTVAGKSVVTRIPFTKGNTHLCSDDTFVLFVSQFIVLVKPNKQK